MKRLVALIITSALVFSFPLATYAKKKIVPLCRSMDKCVEKILNPKRNSKYNRKKAPTGFERVKIGEDVNVAPDGISASVFVLAKPGWDVGNMNRIQKFYFEINGPATCWWQETCDEELTVEWYGPFKGKLTRLVQLPRDMYVVAISQAVIDAHPDAQEVINRILIENDDSVRNFMHTNSNGKFNLATEMYIVEQAYPTSISVINDLDAQVNWATKKGFIIVYDSECAGAERGGVGNPVQAYTSEDGIINIGGASIADCSLFDGGDQRARYVILHELAHTLVASGHAQLVLSTAYDPLGEYRANPAKAKVECSIPFNSMDPEIRALTPAKGCPLLEYGDPFDILGGGLMPYTTYSIFEKQRAGFISETTVNTVELTTPGTYQKRLYPHDAVDPQNHLTHVKIMKGMYGFYSIEYRTQLEPLFSTSKVIIRYAFEEGGNTFLIAALSPGEAYNNPTDNFSVTFTEARDAALIQVQLR